MRRLVAFLLTAAALEAPSGAQPRPPVPTISPIDALRAEFAAAAGGNIVYFGLGASQLSLQARTTLAAQAMWIRQHSEVSVRIEGHGDANDTRDHALAMGAKRAQAVRDYLMMLDVPSAQVSVMSWGKERPGAGRAMTMLAN
ncbi:MAG: OmpA family protein [Sphingomicrobium sp.]